MVLAITSVAIAYGTAILFTALLVFFDDARKAMVSLAGSLYLVSGNHIVEQLLLHSSSNHSFRLIMLLAAFTYG